MTASELWGSMALVIAAAALWGAIAGHAMARTGAAIWPPGQGNWFTAIWAWGLTSVLYVGAYGLGLADWNPYGLPAALTWGIGGTLTVLGNLLHLRSMADLGLAGTSGWDVGVVDTGSYGRLRHPQYTAQGIAFAGWAVLAANLPTLVAAGLGIAALVAVARGEESVLRARHGAAYAAYADRVRGWGKRPGAA